MIRNIALSTLLLAGLTLAVAQTTPAPANPANSNSGPTGIPSVTPSGAANTTTSMPSMSPSMPGMMRTPSMMSPSTPGTMRSPSMPGMRTPSMPGMMRTPSMMSPSTPGMMRSPSMPGMRTPSMPGTMRTPSMMSPSMPGAMTRLNINTATLAQLEREGLSASVAQSVVRGRPYRNQADLLRKVPALNSSNMLKMRSMFNY